MKSTFVTFDTEKLIFALQMPGSVFTILLTVYGFWGILGLDLVVWL